MARIYKKKKSVTGIFICAKVEQQEYVSNLDDNHIYKTHLFGNISSHRTIKKKKHKKCISMDFVLFHDNIEF